MDLILFRTFSHVIIMTLKVDPRTQGGARMLIKESYIKVIDMNGDSGKAQLIIYLRGESLVYVVVNELEPRLKGCGLDSRLILNAR
jgi:hypothetical protein